MRKLARVASIVVNVGELCEKHNPNEEDLPVVLRDILCSHLRFVPSMAMAFRCPDKDQGAEWDRARGDAMKGFKGLLRNNLLKKIKQYDSELSNVLQAFQVGALFSSFA